MTGARDLEKELEELKARLSAVERGADALRDALLRRVEQEAVQRKKTAHRLASLERRTAESARLVKEILESRIWKGLQFAGGMVLRATGRDPGGANQGAKPGVDSEPGHHIQMRCDTLPDKVLDPVAGRIEIRGWAAAPEGVESVEIGIGTAPVIAARYGITRQDIGARFPAYSEAAQSGFLAGFDSRDLPDGIYQVNIRARSKDGKERTLNLPLVINQDTGLMSEYHRWLEVFEAREPELIRVQITGFRYQPLISVLVPVFRTKLAILQETIDSVRRQSYPHWELCLVDDGSGQAELTALLEKNAAAEPRILFLTAGRGGISVATNRALEMAGGEYIALLDHDDLLSEDALFHMVKELQQASIPDLLYSDEDHIDEAGRRFAPFFKPDWSPDLILGENYVCHLMMFRRDLALRAGGFRSEFDLSQDHDILLRMSPLATRICHVPRILYHWRTSLESMRRASNTGDKGLSSSRGAVERFLDGKGSVEPGLHEGRWRVRYPVPAGMRVSILIPTAGKIEMLKRNLGAIWAKAGYADYEIVIIDNSKSGAVERFVAEAAPQGRAVRRFDQRGQPFNYSRLNNLAAATCQTPLLLFLNDDTEGISDGWLLAMVELAARPEVGAVGAKLLYPDGLIQHAGVTMGLAGICGHSFKGLEGKARHYYDFPDLIRNVSAVTAACVMMRAEVFHEVGGFDEQAFPIAYNDIDLSLKIGAAGYRVLYTPHALLYHYEAHSKSEQELHPHPAETLALKRKWKEVIERDPFYNPNLTKDIEDWSLGWG